MEQEWQNDAGALTAQAIPQKDVEQACFHALGLVGRNCEYLEQHLARVGADEQTRQAVNDISAAAARLDRTMNEVMTLLDFLRAEEPPQLSPLDLCQMLQQIAAQADMVQEQLNVELTVLDDGCGLPETSREAWLENRRCFLGGAGLGLLLCRECCRRMGWDLQVEQRAPEKGTRAVVTIPLCDEPMPEPTVELRSDCSPVRTQQQYQLRNMLVRELRTMPERGGTEDL